MDRQSGLRGRNCPKLTGAHNLRAWCWPEGQSTECTSPLWRSPASASAASSACNIKSHAHVIQLPYYSTHFPFTSSPCTTWIIIYYVAWKQLLTHFTWIRHAWVFSESHPLFQQILFHLPTTQTRALLITQEELWCTHQAHSQIWSLPITQAYVWFTICQILNLP